MRSLASQLQAPIRPRPTLFVSEKCMELWDQNTTLQGIRQPIHNRDQITIILSCDHCYSNSPPFRCDPTILIKRRHHAFTSATIASPSACKTGSRGAWRTCPRCHPHPQNRWWRRRYHRSPAYRLWLYNPGGPAAHCAPWGPRTATPSSALWICPRNATPSSARWIRLSRAPQRPQTRTASTAARLAAAVHRCSSDSVRC